MTSFLLPFKIAKDVDLKLKKILAEKWIIFIPLVKETWLKIAGEQETWWDDAKGYK